MFSLVMEGRHFCTVKNNMSTIISNVLKITSVYRVLSRRIKRGCSPKSFSHLYKSYPRFIILDKWPYGSRRLGLGFGLGK